MYKDLKLSQILINAVFIVFSLCCVLPIILLLSASFSNETDIIVKGYSLFPRHISLDAYKITFMNPQQILNSYVVSIAVTILGTIWALFICSTLAYVISRRDFALRNVFSFFLFFTMMFNGGMVPFYILITNYLHLKDSFLVLILPYTVNVFYVLLLRTFMQEIPFSIIEYAKIDGASELQIFFKLIVPLSKPGLATVGLFYTLLFWNDWYLGFLFIEKRTLFPLQLLLANFMSNIEYLTNSVNIMPAGMTRGRIPKETARMAMVVIAVGPMLFVFPFFQKYFIKGLTIGSVKG